MADCPGCGKKVGFMAVLASWDSWGKFICPDCGQRIGFRLWLLAVIVLMGSLVGVERLLHAMLVWRLDLWISFTISFLAAVAVTVVVPALWPLRREE